MNDGSRHPLAPHTSVISTWLWVALVCALLGWGLPGVAQSAALRLTAAQAVHSNATHYPADLAAAPVTLPDDWAVSRPGYSGSVWYRLQFDRPAELADEPLMMHIERVCSNLEVELNGQFLYSGGRMEEPVTRNCHSPQVIRVPRSVLLPHNNVLDLRVRGSKLESVASRDRAGGLSAIDLAPSGPLVYPDRARHFWGPAWAQASSTTLAVIGGLTIALYLLGRREAPLLYFGLMTFTWALITCALAWHNPPVDTVRYELLVAASFSVLGAFTVQFLLSYAGARSKAFESILIAQCLIAPVTLTLAGTDNMFVASRAWHTVIGLEVLLAMGIHLWLAFLARQTDFSAMAALLPAGAAVIGLTLSRQYFGDGVDQAPAIWEIAPTLLLIWGFLLLLLALTRALRQAEVARHEIESKSQETAAEMERSFARMADERVQQVTESERKRIASDLHDDLGAKLLTIVHTSQSERISSLAREALEEMRLSVRGLTGRPMRLMDALGDWRAEIVMRLTQTGIEADWKPPSQDTDQALTARVYVQTTRVLRESVSNIIKHSDASLCTVSCQFDDHEFCLTVQDNGKGISGTSNTKLDRGHGMASMKHRAKQLNGQCLVESAPGFGTVIRLTVPFESNVPTP